MPYKFCAGQRWADPGPGPAKWEAPKQGSGRPALGANINAGNGADAAAAPANPSPAAALVDALGGFRTASAVLSTELVRRGGPRGAPREPQRAQGPGFARAGRSMDEDEPASAEMFPGGAGAFAGAAAPRQVCNFLSVFSFFSTTEISPLVHAQRAAHLEPSVGTAYAFLAHAQRASHLAR